MAEYINESMHLEKEWFEQAGKQTIETLPEFIKHLLNDYYHDYGTVCHAIAACALGAAWAGASAEGITGFQAGFVMWDFIRRWNFPNNESGLRILDYDNMLYPQYRYKFEKTIDHERWEKLQEMARKNLEEKGEAVHPDVKAHWESIVAGNVPFGYVVREE